MRPEPTEESSTLRLRRMRYHLLLLGAVLLWPLASGAAQLIPTLRQRQIGVLIRELHLPLTLHNDLRSGLTSRILLQVDLLHKTDVLARRAVEIDVKYDLWDETFSVSTAIDNLTVSSRTYPRIEEVMEMLATVDIPQLFPVARIPAVNELTLTAKVLFNPVERERIEEIRRWVAENSRSPPANSLNFGDDLPAPAPASDSRELFNKIFEQYAQGASVAAAFTEGATSKPFRLDTLQDEK